MNVTPWIWLIAAAATGVGAYLVGRPAWMGYRSRQARDLNAERYLAWRGRADRTRTTSGEGPTREERRRLWIAAALGLVALAGLVAFFMTS